MYDRLLVALDGSPPAEHVLEHAQALAQAFGSSIILLRAIVSAEMVLTQAAAADTSIGQIAPVLDPDVIVEADRSAAIEYLENIATDLRVRNLKVEIETPEGPANNVIVERAAAIGAGLILMTTHGRSGLGRVVFGSVADSVLRHAPCPVLMVRITEEHQHEMTTSR